MSRSRCRATAATNCSRGYPKYRWLDQALALRRPPAAAAARLAGGALSRARRKPRSGRSRLRCSMPARAERIGEKARRLGLALVAPRSGPTPALRSRAVGIDATRSCTARATAIVLSPLPGLAQRLPDLVSRMQVNDIATYLPDDILTKVDRCTMAVSLEAREPLLDHRLVEFVWSLPRDGASCRRDRRGCCARCSAAISRRPGSTGRSAASRCRSPTGCAARCAAGPGSCCRRPALKAEGLFDAAAVDRLWQRHLNGTENNATGLWNILMIRAWSERWLKP